MEGPTASKKSKNYFLIQKEKLKKAEKQKYMPGISKMSRKSSRGPPWPLRR